jgi:RNA polymerase sigma-70 factor (ECF subfamily)
MLNRPGGAAALPVVEGADAENDSFRAVYAELYPRLAAYAYTLTRDAETAHDIAQETFARLFDRWDRIDAHAPYAWRIATNLARAAWRRQRDDRRKVLAVAAAEMVRPGPADPAAAADVRAVVHALPRRYRDLVLLHYWADLPLPQVAAALSRPLGTVKRQHSEARTLLARALEGTA